MIVIVTESAPPRLRGRLALWMVEVRAGVYVGDYSVKTRERLWHEVVCHIDDGSAVLVWTESNEAGFDFVTVGPNRRVPVDFDGLRLVRYRPPNAPKQPLRGPLRPGQEMPEDEDLEDDDEPGDFG